MSYISQINDAFERIKFNPRGKQLEYVNQIVSAMLDEDAKHIILSAPTGTGKSLLGAVSADVVHQIKRPDRFDSASFLLTATNVLGQQYLDTFGGDDPYDLTFRFLKGASNYECSALSTPEEPQTAENCSFRLFQKSGMDDIVAKHCDSCEYQRNKSMRDRTRHLITNYSYYFTDRLNAKLLGERTVCVFDEVHLLNDLFVEHSAIQFTEKSLQLMLTEITENLQLADTDIFKHVRLVMNHLASGKIDDSSYMKYVQILAQVYLDVSESAQLKADRSFRNHKEYLKLSKMSKKYGGKAIRILDLLEHQYAHVFEYKPKEPKTGQNDHEVTVKPIFISRMYNNLLNAEHNLLMSATISEQYAKRTITFNEGEKVKYIRLEPTFPKENKKVVFFKPQTLNYNTMKDPETMKKLSASCFEIVKHHTDLGERGLILAPSFQVVESIAGVLRRMFDRSQLAVFEHVRGEKLVDWIEAFKDYDKGPAVFLTPSGFEGLDLPGDLSRYQIITKAPFGALGDRRIKVIADSYPDIYALVTLMKITQGAGRSVRGPEDYATTYMLDAAIQRLWTAKNNEWKDEFESRFSSILT